MKEKFFDLEIVTPLQVIYHEKVKHVRLPGTEGYFGILAGHAPFITTLKIGEIKVDLEYETKFFATSGGVVEVLPCSTIILVETAEEASQIDLKRALEAKKRAKESLKSKSKEIDSQQAQDALLKADNRLSIAKHLKNNSDNFDENQ